MTSSSMRHNASRVLYLHYPKCFPELPNFIQHFIDSVFGVTCPLPLTVAVTSGEKPDGMSESEEGSQLT